MHLDQSQRLSAKLHLSPPPDTFDIESVVPIFHHWIQNDRLLDELPVDVANYSHVTNGPGVLLICHRGHYSVDQQNAELGIRFASKRELSGSANDRLRTVLLAMLRAASLLREDKAASEWAQPALPEYRIEFSFEDRLLTPNNDASYASVSGIVRDLWLELLPESDPLLSRGASSGRPLTIRLEGKGELNLADLIEKLAF